MEQSADQRRQAMSRFADCTFCGGEVVDRKIEYDYRRRGRLLILCNVPAGVCRQCGEKYFASEVVKRMDTLYHDVFDHHKKPERVLEVPSVSY
jgi:YgiT-type zinc finger domain-containing protein